MTAVTPHPQETVLEAPAVDVILEFPLDISWYCRALCNQMALERGVVFLDKLVKEGLFRPVALVVSRSAARPGFPANR